MPPTPSINKAAIIRRCILRVKAEYQNDPTRLQNITVQDSILLNLQRACEAAIDLAMTEVARNSLGIPQTSREAFELLLSAGQITPQTAQKLKHMVGFRNLAVHQYQDLQLPIVQSICEKHLVDFETFLKELKL